MTLIGCIADDFTGGTDLANNLVKSGFRTVQTIGIPHAIPQDVDAIVVALKSRSLPAEEAIHTSLEALEWLRSIGCTKFYFKYCSTFDSTPAGNIGPVAESLMHALGEPATLFCPAFPGGGRTVYQGHLFVGDCLLNESGMENHPLNPMSDANIVRWLDLQIEGKVGLIDASVLEQGVNASREKLNELTRAGCSSIVVDTLWDEHLETIAFASKEMKLITGGSGLALGLHALKDKQNGHPATLPNARGGALVLAGSASTRTREQLAHAAEKMPTWTLDPRALEDDFDATIESVTSWAIPKIGSPLLIHSDTRPNAIKQAQQRLGIEAAGDLMERALATIAIQLVAHDIGKLIIAGGETAGAVVNALEITSLRIGDEIDPGVPWTWTESRFGPLHLALKSGNFGAPDMFTRAWDIVE